MPCPRLEVRSRRPRRLAVVAGSERTLTGLVATGGRSGWRTTGASAETTDPLAMTRLLLDPTIEAIVVGAGDPPRADERGGIRELGTLVAAVATRRPDVPIILSGAMSEALDVFGDVAARPGPVMLAPAAFVMTASADPEAPDPLADLLLELALPADDPRRALGAGTRTLAEVLDRRIETIVLGHDAAARAVASPGSGGGASASRLAVVPDAAVAPDEPDDAVDRRRPRVVDVPGRPASRARPDARAAHRAVGGRGRRGRRAPDGRGAGRPRAAGGGHHPRSTMAPWRTSWSWPSGVWVGGARRRRSALAHRRRHAPAGRQPVRAGPRPAARGRSGRSRTTASADGPVRGPRRRPARAARQRRDAGRACAPGESAGSAGRPRRRRARASSTSCRAASSSSTCRRARPRWPSSSSAIAVRLGTRGRHFAVDVAGGLAGLLVDLRDVPLRLPDRADRRRDLLAAWQAALWAGADA